MTTEARDTVIRWPDRSARTLAEVWRLTAEEIEEARRVFVPQPRDWKVAK